MEQFILWNNNWETGFKKIDEQHKHFVNLINHAYSLIHANQKKIDSKKITSLLSDLMEYARIHFSTEEEYFAQTKYPDLDGHTEKHTALLAALLDFNSQFQKTDQEVVLLNKFLVFLKGWLDDHLITADHKYIPWLKNHGVK